MTTGIRALRVGLALIGLGMMMTGPADAVLVGPGDSLTGSGYSVQSVMAGITLDWTATIPDNANQRTVGELLVDLGHLDLSALSFRLRQDAAAAGDSNDAGGLRFLMDVIADNNSVDLTWKGYLIRAEDTAASHVDPTGVSGVGAHRADAHFHNTNPTFGSSPLVLLPPGNNVFTLSFGLGTSVPPGGTFTVNNILVHERDFQGKQRNFDIIFQPVPEPATLLLVTFGIAALAGSAWKRRSR